MRPGRQSGRRVFGNHRQDSAEQPAVDNSAAVRSIGLVVVAKLGRMPLSFRSVSAASFAMGMPTAVAASAVRTQTAPEFADRDQPSSPGLPALQIEFRSPPPARACRARARCRDGSKKASTTRSSLASAPVCDCAAWRPASVRPDFKAMIGRSRSSARPRVSSRYFFSGMLSR